jgi:outer membrane protein assembly factor BamB
MPPPRRTALSLRRSRRKKRETYAGTFLSGANSGKKQPGKLLGSVVEMRYTARSFLIVVALAALSACGGNGTGAPAGTSLSQANAVAGGSGWPNGEASWMAADVADRDLLYVSNSKEGSVDVYSLPEAKLKGRLVNVEAAGLCSNDEGNVFILRAHELLQLDHGGTRAIAVLRDPVGGASQFCAVDPTTGNLAVSGGTAASSGIAIYSGSQGDPKIYRDGRSPFGSVTYDSQGNLFATAGLVGSEGGSRLLELPKGETRLREIVTKGVAFPRIGAIQWDGRFLAAESFQNRFGPATIVRYSVNGTVATPIGRTPAAGNSLQFAIYGSQVAAAIQTIGDAGEPRSVAVSSATHAKVAVTTYHYDNMRTGWNDRETVLTQGNVASASFGLLHTVTVDDQVDTQPLVVPNETTTTGVSQGKHDVVYVTTESNTVYAIDASSGKVLFDQNLGTPVSTPLGCNNNGPNVGIDGTPVIDKNANVMYVIAYTMQGSTPTYYIHELSLADLTDVVPPVLITASHLLSNGDTYYFAASVQRQRPALLEANGNIYAGFGSFCDFAGSQSRGWLLGWQAGSLTPLAANQLNDVLSSSTYDFFLSSIWMSGYGVAADEAGNVYFVTGNSDPSGNSYNSVTNISETVAKLNPDLTQVLSFFTPSNVGDLDRGDTDFGSGGVLLMPKASQSGPPLAAAAGKEGTLFLMNRNELGGYSPSGNHTLTEQYIGGCWCGASYFDAASDSRPRIVASGGNTVTVWKLSKGQNTQLNLAGNSSQLPGGQDGGFFTAVSSNRDKAGAIIWAVARPQYVPGSVTLFAFAAQPSSTNSTLTTLYQAAAGTWESSGANANIVPVVANGKVYVASYEQLDIFGLLGSNAKPAKPAVAMIKAPSMSMGAPHEVTGALVAVRASYLTLRTRTGKIVRVDDSAAILHERSAVLVVGEAFTARGAYDAFGVLHATSVLRAKPSTGAWPPDR